MMVSQGLPELV